MRIHEDVKFTITDFYRSVFAKIFRCRNNAFELETRTENVDVKMM